jgi:hypothetical protein
MKTKYFKPIPNTNSDSFRIFILKENEFYARCVPKVQTKHNLFTASKEWIYSVLNKEIIEISEEEAVLL